MRSITLSRIPFALLLATSLARDQVGVELVSLNTQGDSGNGMSGAPPASISSDRRFVAFDIADTIRNASDFIPKGAVWIKDAVATFQPEANTVTTRDGKTIAYDYLIVCPGIQLNWKQVEGLPETLGKNGVCSNYSFQYAPYTFESLKNLKSGTAIFTAPAGAVKCGGAPQKIMYLAADYLRKAGLAGKVKVEFFTAGGVLFCIEKYAKTLPKV